MDVVSTCPLRVGSVLWRPRPDAWALTVICKATFVLAQGASTLAPEQDPLHEDDGGRGDLAPFKQRAGVIVSGHAYAPRGEPGGWLVARVVVGAVDETVDVHTDRAFTIGGEPGELRPDERIMLENLHASHARLVTSLPGIAPLAAIERGGGPAQEIPLRCDTLAIDTDRGVVNLVWRGAFLLSRADEGGVVRVTAEGLEELEPPTERRRARTGVRLVLGHAPPALEDGQAQPLVLGRAPAAVDDDETTATNLVGPPPPSRDDDVEERGPMTVSPGAQRRAALPFLQPPEHASPRVLPFAAQPPPSAPGLPFVPAPVFGSPPPAFGGSSPIETIEIPRSWLPVSATQTATQTASSPTPEALPFAPPRPPSPTLTEHSYAAPPGSTPALPFHAAQPVASPAPPFSGTPAPPPDVTAEAPAPPPMIGPLATLEMAEPQAPPPEPEPEPVAPPLPAAPAPERPLPIAQCAAIAASLARRKRDRDAILEENELTAARWDKLAAHWADAIRQETRRGRTALLDAYDAAYVARLEEERGPIRVEEYARLMVAAERGTGDEALADLSLPRGAMMRVQRVWLVRLASDAGLSVAAGAAIGAARDETSITSPSPPT